MRDRLGRQRPAWWFTLIVLALAAGVPASALAAEAPSVVQAPPAHSAAELRRRGDEAMDARRAAEALDAYRNAAALEPSPTLDYNIGRALLATGDYAGALASFERFQREAPDALKARVHLLPRIMAELETKVTLVDVRGTPVGARVLVRGIEVGTVPFTARLNAGSAEVRVMQDGFVAFVETRALVSGRRNELDVALAPEPVDGRLSILVRPANATIVIDGRPRGTSPLVLDLPPGAHEILVEATSHHARRISLELAKGESRRVDIALERQAKPLPQNPWFWAGIGVLVTGAAVTTVALAQTRSPDDGSLGTFTVP